MHIAHLVNPILNPVSRELVKLQPLTFESMRIARKQAGTDMHIDLLAAQFAEDVSVIPDYFIQTQNLERSVLDFQNFTRPKKFPLIRDLVERLYNGSKAEYLIYTNADIC